MKKNRLFIFIGSLIICSFIINIKTFNVFSEKLIPMTPEEGEIWRKTVLEPQFINMFGGNVILNGVEYRNGVPVGQPSAPATPANPSAPATPATPKSDNSGNKQPTAQKITVTFTDLFGKAIGSVKVTVGTDVAKSQFPETVEDIEHNGTVYVFEKWDYDGRLMYHDTVIRGMYNSK